MSWTKTVLGHPNRKTGSLVSFNRYLKLQVEAAICGLKQMDEYVLGFSLDWHHEYFFETKARCYIFKEKGEPVGYAYVRPNGGVGPMAVNSDQFTKPVLETALSLSASQPVDNVGYWMPGSNIHAVELALKYRMRLDPFVFMCTKPFAKWENYLFNSAALM